jgi:hypothetical protein
MAQMRITPATSIDERTWRHLRSMASVSIDAPGAIAHAITRVRPAPYATRSVEGV